MPVTQTAKRALRSSKRKEIVNKRTSSEMWTGIRLAQKTKTLKQIVKATSLVDRAAKRGIIHSSKANRIKSKLAKLKPAKSKPKTK